MLVYWSLVLIPILLSMGQPGRPTRASHAILPLLFAVLFIFLALRETGGDYPTYLELYENLDGASLQEALEAIEPGYGLLNWLSSQLGLGIYGVNAACAAIFLYCLYRAASMERDRLLLVTLAIPYFVIVVAMGYTRQGVAAGLILLSVTYLRQGHPWRAVTAVVIAATFHFSAFAAVGLPIIAVTKHSRGIVWFVSRGVLLGAAAYAAQSLFSDRFETYATTYVESNHYQSGGAFLRSLVTAAAGIFFFVRWRDFKKFDDYGIWRLFAVLALAATPLSLIASTPVDRLGLYLLPFQLITFTRLPSILQSGKSYGKWKAVILLNYMLYFFVWLHLGSFADELWVPYRWIFS